MRKLLKTSVNIVLCTALMIALGSTAVARPHDLTQPPSTSEALDLARIQNIPFFVAEVESSNEFTWETINNLLCEIYDLQSEDSRLFHENDISSEAQQKMSQAGIRQLDYAQVLSLTDDPLYLPAFARLHELLADNNSVRFVTFFAPANTTNTDRYGWLFARHGEFEFRYHDVAFNFETHWFTHTNTIMNWSQLASASASLFVDVIGGPVSSVATALGHLANFGGIINVPFNIRITNTTTPRTGIRHRVTGNLVDRLILIEDRRNRESVNAFVGGASLEMFNGRSHLELTHPTRVSGTRIELTDVIYASSPQVQTRTPKWSGNAALFNELIRRHNSSNEWWILYTERLNLHSLVLQLTAR